MTGSTRLSDKELSTFRSIIVRAPLRTTMVHIRRTPIADVEGVLDWLSTYISHVDKHVTRFREEDGARANAAYILRGLRQNLTAAASTLEALDQAEAEGSIPVIRLIPADDDE